MARSAVAAVAYQLKITLKNTKPPVWRRVLTKDCTLGGLHQIIQESMGWGNSHLHAFNIGGEEYGEPDPSAMMEVLDEERMKLSRAVALGHKKFSYEYDFGDDWQHAILVEKTLPVEPGGHYPRCVAGKRACPPEDCGGPWGYAEFLEAISNPSHERHKELLEWVGGKFDPEAFDLDAVNRRLR